MAKTATIPRQADPRTPGRLVVFYDERCDFCCRCRDWLERQQAYLPIEYVAGGAARSQADYAGLPAGSDLVVLGDGGQVWTGPEALLVCLWATERYRPLSLRLGGRSLSTVTKAIYGLISDNRYRL